MGLKGIRVLIVITIFAFLGSAAVVYLRVTRAATLEQPPVPVEPLVPGAQPVTPETPPLTAPSTEISGVEPAIPFAEADVPSLRNISFAYYSKTARKVSLMEAEILVHWQSKIPSISGSSTIFSDLPSLSLIIFSSTFFL